MFALTQSAAVAPARVVAKAQTTAPKARFAVVAKAENKESRRAALVGFTAAAVAAAAKSARAITIASQANTGGLGRATGKGQYSSNASMSGLHPGGHPDHEPLAQGEVRRHVGSARGRGGGGGGEVRRQVGRRGQEVRKASI
jgi:hypothetical protein